MRSLPPLRASGIAIALAALMPVVVPSAALGTTTVNCTTSGSIIVSADGTTVSSGGTCAGTVAIPNTVTTIAASAFLNASGLQSITLPAGLTTIGSNAFRGASALTEITIPAGVTAIPYSAFLGATALGSVAFATPSSVASIGNSAFWDAAALTTITIPASVTSIAYDAFGSHMARVYFSGDAVTIPGGPPPPAQFLGMAAGAVAYRFSNAAGFGAGATWKGFNLAHWMPTPGAPVAVAGDASVAVTAVAPALGPAPTGYTVTAVEDAGRSCTISGASGTCTVTGLANGTPYTFTATATDSYATSARSAASAPVTPVAAPAPDAAPAAPATPAGPSAVPRWRVASILCRGTTCTTRGRVPAGATAVRQTATTVGATAGASSARAHARPGVRTGRCSIARTGRGAKAQRNYTCTLRLSKGSWRITTTAVASNGGLVGRSVLGRRVT